jgi:Rrf2 family protein
MTQAASLGLHAAVFLAGRPGARATTAEAAAALDVSSAHLAKVVARLVHAGLFRAVRGRAGGVALARPAAEITLREVFEAVEGPLRPQRCLLGRLACPRRRCLFGGFAARAAAEFTGILSGHTLASLAGGIRPRQSKRPAERRKRGR